MIFQSALTRQVKVASLNYCISGRAQCAKKRVQLVGAQRGKQRAKKKSASPRRAFFFGRCFPRCASTN